MKLTLRTKTIGARVTDEEYARLEAHADAQGQKLAEWARAVLLRECSGEAPATAGESATLAEVVALRTILLNVLFGIASGEKMTAEEMKKLIERADRDKISKAQQRLGRV
jgi:hypothetical protein